MINVTDIMQSVRYKQQDNNEVKFSDYDIIQSLNEALRYINRSFALKNSDFLEKVQEYRLDEINAEIDEENEELDDDEKKPHVTYRDGFDLPDDLLSIVSITTKELRYKLHPCNAERVPNHREFKVIAGKLYVREDVDLLYRYSIGAVKAESVIDLPDIFMDLLVKITGMILNQNPQEDIMAEANKTLAEELIPVRRYAFRRVFPIWKV